MHSVRYATSRAEQTPHTMIDVHHLDQAVGSALREAREHTGLSLNDVARLTGGRFKPSTVAGYERGERSLSVSRFLALARFYGISPDHLLAQVKAGSEQRADEVVVVLPHGDSVIEARMGSTEHDRRELD